MRTVEHPPFHRQPSSGAHRLPPQGLLQRRKRRRRADLWPCLLHGCSGTAVLLGSRRRISTLWGGESPRATLHWCLHAVKHGGWASCHHNPSSHVVSLNLLLCCSKLLGVSVSARRKTGSVLAVALWLIFCSLLLNTLIVLFTTLVFLLVLLNQPDSTGTWPPALLYFARSGGVFLFFSCLFFLKKKKFLF